MRVMVRKNFIRHVRVVLYTGRRGFKIDEPIIWKSSQKESSHDKWVYKEYNVSSCRCTCQESLIGDAQTPLFFLYF